MVSLKIYYYLQRQIANIDGEDFRGVLQHEWLRTGMGTYLKWGTYMSQKGIPIHSHTELTLLARIKTQGVFTFAFVTLIHTVYFVTIGNIC